MGKRHLKGTSRVAWLCSLLVVLGMTASGTLSSPANGATGAQSGAVSWARPYADRHDTSYNGLCLSFVFNAYSAAGISLRPWVTVPIGYNTYPADIWGHFNHGTTGGGTPPFGALVFWRPQNGDRTNSHVALSLGDGNLVSTSDGVANYTHYETMAAHSYAVYQGWWLPEGSGGDGGGAVGEGSIVSHNGFVYRIAGGAPIYVSNWGAIGGPQTATPLSDAQFAGLPQFPRDGTLLDGSAGRVYVVAGGAPLYLSTYDAIGGPRAGIRVDEAAIDNAGGGVPWDHLRPYPADGTLLDSSDGRVYIVAGGAPLYLSTYDVIGGPRPGVRVDGWDVANTSDPNAHLRPYPADGTFLNTSLGQVYRVAGGAPMPITTWDIFGGVQPYVTVDQWAVDHRSEAPAHLLATPVDGTSVMGLPSGRFWTFKAGLRSPGDPTSGAVAVDDAGLGIFAIRSTAMTSAPIRQPESKAEAKRKRHRARHHKKHRQRHHGKRKARHQR